MQIKQMLFWLMSLLISGTLTSMMTSCSDDDSDSGSYGVGTITGVITDDYNAPLGDVQVTVNGTDQKTSTNANGEYTLENVPISKTILTFEKNDYQTISVTVTPKSYTSQRALVNASMEYAAAHIRGTVLDAKRGNVPMKGVKVSISDALSTVTGDDGTYTIDNLPLKSYTVTFSYDGYETVTRTIGIDGFTEGTANIDVTMGARQILPHKTLDDLLNCDLWAFSEIRGGRNAENYPHWDWSTDFMATLDFYGQWEEQNEGTTLQIKTSTSLILMCLDASILLRTIKS